MSSVVGATVIVAPACPSFVSLVVSVVSSSLALIVAALATVVAMVEAAPREAA